MKSVGLPVPIENMILKYNSSLKRFWKGTKVTRLLKDDNRGIILFLKTTYKGIEVF
jgi:hypothetical protein